MTKVDLISHSVCMQTLNLEALKTRLSELGLNQTDLAQKLKVSKEIVSKWIRGEKFPRPDKLLRLASALELPFKKLVCEEEDPFLPRIAFRKRANTKTKPEHFENAKEKAMLLRRLAPYLQSSKSFVKPTTLKNPILEYAYIQKFAQKIRTDIGLQAEETVNFHSLVGHFERMQAVLIPVLWGEKQHHENALHIYLPDSMTTWVFLNLDVNVHDFKFWMAHELGHVYSYDSFKDNDTAEDFADDFAGALLFPNSLAEQIYEKLSSTRSLPEKFEVIRKTAHDLIISPVTISKEIDKFADEGKKPKINLGTKFYGFNTNFNKGYKSVSETLFEEQPIKPSKYKQISEELFKTEYFQALGKFIDAEAQSASCIQNILDISRLDAEAIYEEMMHGTKEDSPRY